MNIKSGDKIKFGIVYCNKECRKDLLNKTIMLTPQSFEYDNGLYTEDQVCPGIYNEAEGEPESIYHLFGNHFESFYDCQLIPATEEDLKLIADIKKAEEELILQDMQNMVDFFEGLERAAAEHENSSSSNAKQDKE